MSHHAALESLHRGTQLATSVNPTSPDRLGWLGIYPLDLKKHTIREFLRARGVDLLPQLGHAYRIRSFEVRYKLIEAGVSIGETELENQTDTLVWSDDELLNELAKHGVTIENLALPYKSNYPI